MRCPDPIEGGQINGYGAGLKCESEPTPRQPTNRELCSHQKPRERNAGQEPWSLLSALRGSAVHALTRSPYVRRTPRQPAKLRRLRWLRQVHLVVGRLPHLFSTRNSRTSCSAFSLPKLSTISSHNPYFPLFSCSRPVNSAISTSP